MRWPLIHHLKDRGLLILSGILEGEKDRLRQHYMNTKLLQWVRADRDMEWVCLIFKKKR
jgi:ribosomal protein L11 methylase PrmA